LKRLILHPVVQPLLMRSPRLEAALIADIFALHWKRKRE
jgi:hypothetical protein